MVFHLQLVRHTSPVFSALAQHICIPQCPDELQRHQCLCRARFPGRPLGVCHAGEAALSLHPLCCASFCLAFPLAVSCHPSVSTCFNTSEETSLSPYPIQSCLTSKILSKTTYRLPRETAPMLNTSNETLLAEYTSEWQSTVSNKANKCLITSLSTQARISSCNWATPLHELEDMLPSRDNILFPDSHVLFT